MMKFYKIVTMAVYYTTVNLGQQRKKTGREDRQLRRYFLRSVKVYSKIDKLEY